MESRIEDILSATISGKSYNKPGESRIENLLIDLKGQIDDKVDKVSGKGLSTNDFTTAEKTKLDDLAEIKSIGTGLALDSTTGELIATGGGGGGTSDYTALINKPQINSVILSGNKSLSDLGITYESKTAVSDGTALSLVTTGEKYDWNNKQSALTIAQLDAVNSGITSEDVAEIETNKNNIADIKDGTSINSFGDVETALGSKQNTISDLATIRSGAALGATAVQPETGKGLSTNDYTTAEKTKLEGIAEGAEVNVQSNWTQTTTTADDYIKNKPTLGTAAAKNATDTYNATGTDVTTGKAVAAALATLPEPMVFKGSLGTGGTITTLPTASSSNKGYVYKVITAGTYASQSAKVGDTFISDGSAWVLIPSGDEPSGTVTNVAVANGGGLTVGGSPITSSGTITVGHSNSVTAKTNSSLKKFTYDAYGHVTGSSELSTAESNALASGIESTKVEQIETNKNNISYNTNNGVKNIWNVTIPSDLPSGFTITRDSDGGFVFNGNTGNSAVSCMTQVWFGKERYVLSGCPSGGSDDSYRIDILRGDNSVICYGDPVEAGGFVQTKSYTCRIRIAANYTCNNLKFYPMICLKSLYDADPSYQPYALSNAELTAAIQALQAQLANQ